MSEDLGFDLKKKKKSAKKNEDTSPDVESTTQQDEIFAGLKKKKKKPTKSLEGESSEINELDSGLEGLSLKKKKKKSTKSTDADDFDKQLEQAGISVEDETTQQSQQLQQQQSDDATVLSYPNLLSRFFTILKEKNPELAGGLQSKLKIPPPDVQREGNKKTMFANVQTISTVLQRNPEHLIQYLFAELGTSGSIDGEKRLIIKGRFQAKNIESVLRRYIQEYVICKTCKSMNTDLKRESTNRLHFIVCKACGSTKSVSSIKTGFQAHVGRRKKA